MKNKIALVTGATSGIGQAAATKLAAIGYNVIITGRREERLQSLKKELESNYKVEIMPLCFDIQVNDATSAAFNSLPADWKKIDVLVNNAGLAASADPVQDAKWEDWEQMIDTNIKGLLFMSKLVIPFMIEANNGIIINISSIAGKQAYAGGNVYSGTKHAVEAISQGMRIDLLKHNIKVSTVSPGMVETEFSIVRYKGDTEKAAKVYEGVMPLFAEDIADTIEFIVTRPPHVNINDILIMPSAQADAFYKYPNKHLFIK